MCKFNEEEMLADISEDTAVIINTVSGVYYATNKAGCIVLNCLISGYTLDETINEIKKVSGVPADIDVKIKKFADELIEKRVVVDGQSPKQPVEIKQSCLEEDNFDFTIGEYADAQELLKADPIHEVAKEEGWQPVFRGSEDDDK